MTDDYDEKELLQLLQEATARLEESQKQHRSDTAQLRQIIDAQTKQIAQMAKEIQMLLEEGARLRNRLNNK